MSSRNLGFTSVSVLFITVLLVVVAGYFIRRSRQQVVPEKTVEVVEVAPDDGSYRIEFPYKVRSINTQKLVLRGRDGDFTLTRGFISSVFRESPQGRTAMKIEELKIGDTVSVEVIPRKSASLLVSVM